MFEQEAEDLVKMYKEQIEKFSERENNYRLQLFYATSSWNKAYEELRDVKGKLEHLEYKIKNQEEECDDE